MPTMPVHGNVATFPVKGSWHHDVRSYEVEREL